MKEPKPQRFNRWIGATSMLFFAAPLLASAQDTKTYTTLSNIPNFKEVKIESIAGFINLLVEWTIGIGGALAVIMIIWGGIQIMISDAEGSKTAGKQKIESAIWGVIIGLTSYLLLVTINPNLVDLNFAVSKIQNIEKSPAIGENSGLQPAPSGTPGGSSTSTTSPSGNIGNVSGTGNGLTGSTFKDQATNDYVLGLINNSQLRTIVPQDAATYFPNGVSPQGWVNLVAGIVSRESGFDPNKQYTENFKDSTGNFVISTGLMQLSQESVRGYGFNATTEQLKNPQLNLQIGVKILEKWVVQDRVVSGGYTDNWKGGARYWSVLR